MGDEETQEGAKTRSKSAFDAHVEKYNEEPNFGVGLEGGVTLKEFNSLECFAWGVVYNGERYGTSKSASFTLPKAIGDLVAGGMELGHADDKVFGTINSKQGQGTIGQLTRGIISRTDYYVPMIVLACVPFMWPSLYPKSEEIS